MADVTRHDGDDGSWELRRWSVPDELRQDVLRITGYEERLAAPVRFHELPGTFVPLILNAGSPHRVADGSGLEECPASFVAGVYDVPVVVESDGAALLVQVDVTPSAASRLLGVPMHELARRTVPLDGILGADVRRLEEQLSAAPAWRVRKELAVAFVARRLAEAPQVRPDVAWALRRMRETGGCVPVGELASELGCSRKHLNQRFRETIGLSPKSVAQLVRFNRALRLLAGGMDAAAVAAQAGYADQPHFAKEFRRFTGVTPGAFLRERQVQFVQDGPARAA